MLLRERKREIATHNWIESRNWGNDVGRSHAPEGDSTLGQTHPARPGLDWVWRVMVPVKKCGASDKRDGSCFFDFRLAWRVEKHVGRRLCREGTVGSREEETGLGARSLHASEFMRRGH